MTQRHFVTPDYTVFAGWNPESQSLYLNIYHHFWEDPADRNRYDTPLTSEAPTVADVAEALARYHITPPAYFLEDLAEDQAHNEHTDRHVTYQMPVDLDETEPQEGDQPMTEPDPFDPNLDPHLGQSTWYRFTLPTGQEFLRTAADVTEADWDGASAVDVFRQARWEPTQDGGWLLFGTKDTGQRLPITVIEGHGNFDVHYDPETGSGSVQAEYGDRPDLGDAPLMRGQQDFLHRVRLSGDEIVRITFESGDERVIPASEFHQTVASSERVAFFETYSPQDWIAQGGELPFTQPDQESERPDSTERPRLQALAERIRDWFHRDRDRGMGL